VSFASPDTGLTQWLNMNDGRNENFTQRLQKDKTSTKERKNEL